MVAVGGTLALLSDPDSRVGDRELVSCFAVWKTPFGEAQTTEEPSNKEEGE